MTNEVSLRDVRESDLLVFFEHQRDPEATRMAAFPARTRDEVIAHWARIMADGATVLRTIVFEGEVAGNIVAWEHAGELRVGYWLGREFWGKGVATLALSQFLAQVKTRPIYARVARGNVASIRVLQKCGFVISGENAVPAPSGELSEEFILTLGANDCDEPE